MGCCCTPPARFLNHCSLSFGLEAVAKVMEMSAYKFLATKWNRTFLESDPNAPQFKAKSIFSWPYRSPNLGFQNSQGPFFKNRDHQLLAGWVKLLKTALKSKSLNSF